MEAIQRQFVDAPWELGAMTLDAMFGTVELRKANVRVTISYIETGILRPEITVSVSGGDLELVPSKPVDDDPKP